LPRLLENSLCFQKSSRFFALLTQFVKDGDQFFHQVVILGTSNGKSLIVEEQLYSFFFALLQKK
jgi:hypothetical protein